jgi:hypothetical protein
VAVAVAVVQAVLVEAQAELPPVAARPVRRAAAYLRPV